jgi:hypothetical protein
LSAAARFADAARGWRAYAGVDETPDEPPEVVIYCPERT